MTTDSKEEVEKRLLANLLGNMLTDPVDWEGVRKTILIGFQKGMPMTQVYNDRAERAARRGVETKPFDEVMKGVQGDSPDR